MKRIRVEGLAQGTSYHITYYANDTLVKKTEIDSIVNSLDSTFSLYKPYSLLCRFNASGSGLEVNQHFIRVWRKSMATYRDTKAIFDITVEPLTEAWGFGPHRSDTIPDSATIARLMECVGSRYVTLQGNRLVKSKPCVKLDVNGIAQGYSVDVLAQFFDSRGVKNYVIELGGELRVKGKKQPGGEKMKIGIEVPGNNEMEMSMDQELVYLDHGALTTSGSYRKYYESAGKRISHLLDARTGYPEQNELISVTVYASDAITADAYDNALMVMGLQKALAFVEQRKFLAAHFIYHRKDGSIADTASSRFYKLFKP